MNLMLVSGADEPVGDNECDKKGNEKNYGLYIYVMVTSLKRILL